MKRIAALAVASCFAVLAFPAAVPAQDDATVAILRDLANAHGPSGFEEPVRKIMVDRLKPVVDRISYDGMGSVIAEQGASGPKIMLDAHMDELGGMIRRITPDGYLSMQTLGGWLDQALPDQRWVILTAKGPIEAVTGIRDVHSATADERARVIPREAILLDVGAKTAAEARAMGIEAGDPVAPDSPFQIMNGTKNYLGKAWDDRAGCAVLVAVARRMAKLPHPNRIVYAATTQEEVGLRGAHSAADAIKPELGIAIEGGITGDTPGARPDDSQVKLGAGPGIFLFDTSALPNRKLAAYTKATAAAKAIPLQLDSVLGYGDDSSEIQKSTAGVPTVNLVVPVRYTHAHDGIMNRGDFDGMVDLIVAMLQKLDGPAVARIRDFTPQ
jgi:endoglucanase